MGRVTRGVSFNLNDPIEYELNQRVEKMNFSKYVKRLIERDLFQTPLIVQKEISSEPFKVKSIPKMIEPKQEKKTETKIDPSSRLNDFM